MCSECLQWRDVGCVATTGIDGTDNMTIISKHLTKYYIIPLNIAIWKQFTFCNRVCSLSVFVRSVFRNTLPSHFSTKTIFPASRVDFSHLVDAATTALQSGCNWPHIDFWFHQIASNQTTTSKSNFDIYFVGGARALTTTYILHNGEIEGEQLLVVYVQQWAKPKTIWCQYRASPPLHSTRF